MKIKYKLAGLNICSGASLFVIASMIMILPKLIALLLVTAMFFLLFEVGQWDMYSTFKSWSTARKMLWKDTIMDILWRIIGVLIVIGIVSWM